MRAFLIHFSYLLCLAGCGRGAAEEKELTVFAAASLRDAFTRLGKDFEGLHPGIKVQFNFAGTQELRTQIEQGARADVFASADLQHMAALQSAGKVADSFVFAQNELVIAVAKDSRAPIAALADLPAATRLVVGAPEVPVGRYTGQVLDRAAATLGADFRARVEAKVISRELNVRQVLAKITLGEADAGIVYRTDVQSSDVKVVVIPPELNVVAEYPVAVVVGGEHPGLAGKWLELLRSPAGRAVLQKAGFRLPTL